MTARKDYVSLKMVHQTFIDPEILEWEPVAEAIVLQIKRLPEQLSI
jgi:hypothetical protein